jgi:hypothetical protein
MGDPASARITQIARKRPNAVSVQSELRTHQIPLATLANFELPQGSWPQPAAAAAVSISRT